MAKAINAKDKAGAGRGREGASRSRCSPALLAEFPEQARDIGDELEDIEYRVMRAQVLEKGERVDGRDLDTIRPITIEAGVLPRAHGSALFTRGQTQALVAVTLGTADDEQRIDSIDVAGETTKSFMLHYNFPPFSTGEVRPIRGTSRREIGHGALAERALQPLLPALRGLPLHDPRRLRDPRVQRLVVDGHGVRRLAGADGRRRADARRLRRRGDGPDQGRRQGRRPDRHPRAPRTTWATWTSRWPAPSKGITSIQMDIKIEGLDLEIMAEALEQARKGRLHILDEMDKALAAPRAELSPYAPRIVTIQIKPGEDRRRHRPEGQDDPRHPGRDRRQDQHRRLPAGHHRGGRRRGGREGARAWSRRSRPSPRSARSTRAR